jgi:tetratricopeptide (TPR) repeat protein
MKNASTQYSQYRSRIAALLIAWGALWSSASLAVEPLYPSDMLPEKHYEECLAQVQSDVAAAFDNANGWISDGGGPLARHCLALALLKMGKPATAAKMLDDLAGELIASRPELVPDALAQGAQAWAQTGDLTQAIKDQTDAIKERPRDPELLIDRAQFYVEQKQFREAVQDLTQALALDPRNVDALVYRGSAYRHLNTLDLATNDLEEAVKLAPEDPDALLERGILRRLKNDRQGARQDWLKLLVTTPDAPAADIARADLEALDVKVEPATPPAKP